MTINYMPCRHTSTLLKVKERRKMNLDITKYLKNKDITISNDDLDLDKMSKDLYKGYTKNSDIEKPDYSGYVKKEDFDKLQSDYTTMENNYNNQTKVLSDTNENMARVSFESTLVRKGFKEENFDEVVKLRNSLYADEKDDQKAVDSIAERFKNTYFAEEKPPYTPAPNENGGVNGNNGSKTNDIKITRNTSIKDLILPVTK